VLTERGVVHVIPVDPGRAGETLTAPVDEFDLDTSSAGTAIHAIRTAIRGGRYSDRDSSAWPAAPVRPQLKRSIRIHLQHTTVEKVLDAIVAERGGLAWVIETRESDAPLIVELKQY
jgi:hypothetical protein